MANRILLQTLLRFSDQIKSGAAKVQDVITDYFNTTGKSVTDEERGIILKEFQDNAPSNVTTFEGVDPRETIMSTYRSAADDMTDVEKDDVLNTFLEKSDRVYANFVNKALVDLQKASKSEQQQMVKAIIGRKGMFKYLDDADAKKLLNSVDNPGAGTGEVVGLRGDETFDELMDLKNNLRSDRVLNLAREKGITQQGLGSLYPKGKPGEIFDIQNDKRMEVAAFMKAMREAGIKNEDVMKTAKITDVAEGKRAATTLARAADMAADTKVKQEFLSELDEKIADKGPRFFNEEYQGFDSYGALVYNEGKRIRNAIYDDLEEMGVDEDTISRIIRSANEVAERSPYEPEAFMASIKDDLEINEINYNTDFWDNYISKILELSIKPEPRFADGGLV